MSKKKRSISRQRAWQQKQVAEGNCRCCGLPRNLYSHECDDCYNKETKRRRKKSGHKPWKRGGRGRPPKDQPDA